MRGNRNRVRAAPESHSEILIGNVLKTIAHLNLSLTNLPRLNDNVRPILTLISYRRERCRSSAAFGGENDRLRIYELSWRLHATPNIM
jgi:hypothetical protein